MKNKSHWTKLRFPTSKEIKPKNPNAEPWPDSEDLSKYLTIPRLRDASFISTKLIRDMLLIIKEVGIGLDKELDDDIDFSLKHEDPLMCFRLMYDIYAKERKIKIKPKSTEGLHAFQANRFLRIWSKRTLGGWNGYSKEEMEKLDSSKGARMDLMGELLKYQ